MGVPCGQRQQHDATAHGVLVAGQWFGATSRCCCLNPGCCLPCSPRKRAYSKEAVYSDKLQHYSTGRGEQGKREKQMGDAPKPAPTHPLPAGTGGWWEPHGRWTGPGGSGDVHMCLSGCGEGGLQWCSTVGGKEYQEGSGE